MLPDHLPIVAARMASGAYAPVYHERELSEPGALCDARGDLDRAAVGWSRTPLVTANLRRHWPRKKRWNFWNWISRDFVLSLTVANLDLASFCALAFVDCADGRAIERMDVRRSGFAVLPEQVERDLTWRSDAMACALRRDGDDMAVQIDCADVQGAAVRAPHSGAIDLTLTPLHAKTTRLNLGLLATGGTCVFGTRRGRVRAAKREIAIDGLVGWAEELAHRW